MNSVVWFSRPSAVVLALLPATLHNCKNQHTNFTLRQLIIRKNTARIIAKSKSTKQVFIGWEVKLSGVGHVRRVPGSDYKKLNSSSLLRAIDDDDCGDAEKRYQIYRFQCSRSRKKLKFACAEVELMKRKRCNSLETHCNEMPPLRKCKRAVCLD